MSKIVKYKLPCLECSSSDARQLYEDGSSYCFSCMKDFQVDEKYKKVEEMENKYSGKLSVEEIQTFPIRGFEERKIKKVVTEFYQVRVSYNSEGKIDTHYYPYNSGKAYKIRKFPKEFMSIGNVSEKLFGQELFPGEGRRLIITEGEIDAMSVAQAQYDKYKKFYPAVSIASATNFKSLLVNREWIRSFKEVVLCFDPDDQGQKATQEAIKIIGVDKVRITKLPKKDPNEVLVQLDSFTLMNALFDAASYIPNGIISKEEIWERLCNKSLIPAIPYPPCMSGINSKLKGQRANEITLFISATGSGKSSLIREIILHDLKVTEDPVGLIILEELPEESALKLSGMALNRNPAKEEIPIEELKPGFDEVFKDDRVILLNHEGNFSDGTILDKIEYMCLSGCKHIFIDHITILVAEGIDHLAGNEAIDRVMADLSRIVKKYPVWIGLVSHLRKVQSGGKSFEEGKMPALDDIKGSGSIKQISYDIVAFTRNMIAEDELVRNHIKVCILKARTTALTGPCRGMFYVYDTGRLIAALDDEGFQIEQRTIIIEPKDY